MNILAKIGSVTCIAITMIGCATSSGEKGGMSDADAIAMVIDKWEAGIKAEDISLSIDHYSDNYEDAESGNKAEYIERITSIIEQGFLKGAEIDRGDADVLIKNNDEATYGPIDLATDVGGWTVDIMLKKEAGSWKIISSEVY